MVQFLALPRRRLKVFFASRDSFYWLCGLGLLLMVPSLFAGFFADDFSHVVLVNNLGIVPQPDNLSLFHLFSFITEDASRREQLQAVSALPWWVNPEFRLVFWRPLAELTHYFDYRWLNAPPLMHLHSLCWYAVLLLLVMRVYKLFCSNQSIALLALFLFVVDATHGFTVAWLANRNAVMAGVFSMAALLSHHHWRQQHQWGYGVLSGLFIALSFLSAEAGISVGIFLLAYALLLDRKSVFSRGLSLLPALTLFLVWASVYHHYDYGAFGNKAYYVNLVSSPAYYLQNFISRFPEVIAIQFNFLPLHLMGIEKSYLVIFGWLVMLWLMVWLVLMRRIKDVFFMLIMCLAIVPIASAEIQERNMLFVGIAACPLLAAFLFDVRAFAQRYLLDGRRFKAGLAYSLIAFCIFFHGLMSALIMLPTAYAPKLLAAPAIGIAHSLPEDITDKHIISIGVPLFEAGFLSAIRWSEKLSLPRRYWNVSTHAGSTSVTRMDDYSLRIERPGGLLGGMDFLLRDRLLSPIRVGEQHHMQGLTLLVEQVNEDAVPVAIKVTSSLSLDADNMLLCFWQAGRLEPVSLAVSEQLTL